MKKNSVHSELSSGGTPANALSPSLTGYLRNGRRVPFSSNVPADRPKSPEENFLQTFNVDGEVDPDTAKMIARLSGNEKFPDTKEEKLHSRKSSTADFLKKVIEYVIV